MKILLVNKFYYPRGGDCLVTISMEELLKAHGHQVAIFSMQYPNNLTTETSSLFPSEISFSGEGISSKISAVKRLLGKDEVAVLFRALLNEFKPDIVHLHNIHSYISPIVGEIAKRQGIRVVWTLHDYKLICPAYSFLRESKVCELCLTNPLAVMTKKCMKKNVPASLLAYIESLVWNKKRLTKNTDIFVCPSLFMAEKMQQGGFPAGKMKVLPNFISFKQTEVQKDIPKREKAYCYIGRLSEEKGIKSLLEAASTLPFKLYIAGTGPMLPELESCFQQKNIIYLGHLSQSKVKELLAKVTFSVTPSICYENNPLSVIESLSAGTPVLGAHIGGIPELIKEHKNGMLFIPGNIEDLKSKIVSMFEFFEDEDGKRSIRIATEANQKYSGEHFYTELLKIYLDQ